MLMTKILDPNWPLLQEWRSPTCSLTPCPPPRPHPRLCLLCSPAPGARTAPSLTAWPQPSTSKLEARVLWTFANYQEIIEIMFRISSYSEELHQKLCSFAQTTGVLNHQVQLKWHVVIMALCDQYLFWSHWLPSYHFKSHCHCHIMCQAKVTCHIKLNKS